MTVGYRKQGLVLMAAGFTIWAVAFSLLYAVQAIGCELSWNRVLVGPASWLRILLVSILLGHLIGLAALYYHCRKRFSVVRGAAPLDRFLWRASTALTAAAVVGTIWIGMALLVPSICSQT